MASIATQTDSQPVPARFPRSVMGVRILGTGAYAPSRQVTNEDLASLGCDPEWIVQRTGIKARRHAEPGESTSDLAYQAARRCLDAAGVQPSEVDLIIVCTMTPDHYTPSASCLVQSRLGCAAPAFDLNAACSGFMYGLVTAAQFVRNGCSQMALVVGADVMSKVVDPLDRKTFPLFGDGAGAALISRDEGEGEGGGILAYRLSSVGQLSHLLVVPGCGSRLPASPEVLAQRGQFLKMEGPSVFKWAVRLVPDIVQQTLDDAQLTIDDIDLVLLHQANKRIIDAAVEHLNVPPEKLVTNLERYGNTSAASIPILLDEAISQGMVHNGCRILMCGFGAGLTWGSCILQW